MKITQPARVFGTDQDNNANVLDSIYKLSRANVSFGSTIVGDVSQNIKGVMVDVTTPGVADTDFTVTHNLNQIPTGFLVMKASGVVLLYDGSVAWNAKTITLRSGVPNINVRLFITAT